MLRCSLSRLACQKYTGSWLRNVAVRHVSSSDSKNALDRPSQSTADDDLDKTFDRLQSKILYSSYFESFGLKLSHRVDKVVKGKLTRIERDKRLQEVDEKPIPLALKYLAQEQYNRVTGMDEAKDEVKEKPEEKADFLKENLENKRRYFIPFSQVQSVLEQEPDPVDKTLETDKAKWMKNYEYYNEEEEQHSLYGTPDPSVPVSDVPCSGCGAHLHCADTGLPGYIPSEIFKGRTNRELTKIICQRCHFLKSYNMAINVTVTPEDYIKIISSIKDKKALAVLMVDLLDLENSIWPDIREILGKHRPLVVVGNKVDLLPRDAPGHLDHVRKCVYKAIVESGFDETQIKHVGLISATTGFGVEELITQIHNIWGYKGDVYIVGCTNVGKSSLFNALLQSDFCKTEASDIIQRATASPWPGTTLKLLKFPILNPSGYRLHLRTERLKRERESRAEEEKLRRMTANETSLIEHATLIGHIGRTFTDKYKEGQKEQIKDPFSGSSSKVPNEIIHVIDENKDRYKQSKWCYDTPGVVQPEQILNLLTTEELLKVIPKKMIVPRTFLLKRDLSIFLGGLGRVDYVEGVLDSIRVQIYASHLLPTMITRTEDAEELYDAFLGTKVLGVPFGSDERLGVWPELKPSEPFFAEGIDNSVNCCDLLLSSAGWLSVSMPKRFSAKLRVWTPDGKGVVIRKPALIPYGIQLKGKRIRHTFSYHMTKPFISFQN